ncbi:MAG: sulfite exporter TauE/SafE family protein [Terrimicrobiaceae bacterium]
MNLTIVIVAGLFGLSVISGMLGLGVAFAAIPFLGFFLTDLVHEIQPLSLILNGITAFFSAFGFSRSGLVDWRRAGMLCLVTTTFAPIGAWLAQTTDRRLLWVLYFCAVLYLSVQMFRPAKAAIGEPRYGLALLLAIPISVLSGLLGVGPGFLLLPCLILLGVEPKHAAAINAVAVTPPSFSALIPHIGTMRIDPALAVMLIVAGAAGSFLGARLTSVRLSGPAVKRLFGVLLVVMTAVQLYRLLRA